MDYNLLLQLKDRANKVKTDLPPEVAASFNDSFNVEYAHNSTAIEGNTLTLIQTKAVIEDGLSVGGENTPRNIRGCKPRKGIRLCAKMRY